MLFAESETSEIITAVFGGIIGIITAIGAVFSIIAATKARQANTNASEAKALGRENADAIGTVAVKQEIAAKKAEAVKSAVVVNNRSVARKLDTLTEASAERTKLIEENTEITKSVLSFVNGPLTAERRLVANLARRLADKTVDPADRRSAEEAEERLKQAVERQLAGGDSGNISIVKVPSPGGSS